MPSLARPSPRKLRPMVSRGLVFAIQKPAKSPFTTSGKALKQPGLPAHPSRYPITARVPPHQYLLSSSAALRQASSSAPAANQTTTSEDILTWDRFFDLRRKRRYLNLGSSLITAGTTVAILGPVIVQQDIDGWAANISGLNQFAVLGITTFAIGAGGWLCGPSFGTALFKIWAGRKGWNLPIAEVSTPIRSMERPERL